MAAAPWKSNNLLNIFWWKEIYLSEKTIKPNHNFLLQHIVWKWSSHFRIYVALKYNIQYIILYLSCYYSCHKLLTLMVKSEAFSEVLKIRNLIKREFQVSVKSNFHPLHCEALKPKLNASWIDWNRKKKNTCICLSLPQAVSFFWQKPSKSWSDTWLEIVKMVSKQKLRGLYTEIILFTKSTQAVTELWTWMPSSLPFQGREILRATFSF